MHTFTKRINSGFTAMVFAAILSSNSSAQAPVAAEPAGTVTITGEQMSVASAIAMGIVALAVVGSVIQLVDKDDNVLAVTPTPPATDSYDYSKY
jgi:hypothetical protein